MRFKIFNASMLCFLWVLCSYPTLLAIFRSRLTDYFALSEFGFVALLSVNPLLSIIMAIVAGWLVDRRGATTICRVGLWGVAIGMLLMGGAGRNLPVFFTGMVIFSLFFVPMNIATSVYLTNIFPENKRKVFSLNLAITGLGSMAMPLLIEWMMARWTIEAAIHFPFLMLSVLLASAGFYRPLWSYSVIAPTEPIAVQEKSTGKFPFPWPILMIIFLMAMHGANDVSFGNWLPKYLETLENGVPAILLPGAVLAWGSLMYLLTRVLLLFMPEHFGRRLFLILPGVIGGVILIAGILSESYVGMALAYVAGSFCWSWEYPNMFGILAGQGKILGKAYALVLTFSNLLTVVVMSLVGLLAARSGGLRMAMLLPAAGFLFIGLGGIILLLGRSGREMVTDDSGKTATHVQIGSGEDPC